MDKAFISEILEEASIHIDISALTLARELWEKIPEKQIQDFASTIIRHCENYCKPLLPNGTLTILLISDEGKIYGIGQQQ